MLSLSSWSRWPRILTFAPALSLAVTGTALAAGSHNTPLTTRSAASALVKTAPAQILTNAHGMTLYLYTPDKRNKSVCYGECAEYWPPLLAPKGAMVPATLSGIPGTFGTAVRTGGARQVTYDGAPLYTWIKDKKPGDMTGQGVGNIWWVMVAPMPKAAATTSASGTQVEATSTPQQGQTATATPSSYYGGHGRHGGDG